MELLEKPELLLSGWSHPEPTYIWSVGPSATIAMPMLSRGEVRLTLDVTAPPGSPRTLTLLSGDRILLEQPIAGRRTVTVTLAENDLGSSGILTLQSSEVGVSSGDTRPLALCYAAITVDRLAPEVPAPGKAPAILLFGNSHVGALAQGWRALETSGDADFRLTTVELPPGHRWLNFPTPIGINPWMVSDLVDEAEALSATAIVSALHGNGHFVFGAAEHVPPMDFVDPDAPDAPIDADALLVPHAAVEELVRRNIALLVGKLFGALADATERRLPHVSAPPPEEDESSVRERLEAAFSRTGDDDVLADLRVAPPAFRLKSWRLYERVVRETVEQAGGLYLPPPPETQDKEGFLLPAFAGDGLHANTAYGSAVMRQISASSGIAP